MKKTLSISLLTLAALAGTLVLSTGCKKVSLSMMYQLTPYVQAQKSGPEVLAQGVIAYTFYADTAQWAVTSYENAEKGVLTHKKDQSEKSFDLKTEQNEQGVLEIGPLLNQPVIMVVCDVPGRIYAWRQVEVAENLPLLIVRIRFRPWKTEKEYKEANWNMVNETPPAEPDPEPTPDPEPDPTPES